MPRMGGLDLQSRLRAKGLRTPIIFITAYPEEPFDSETLIKCLDLALKRETGDGALIGGRKASRSSQSRE
jgi:CheY-like chemotaxis protein